MTRLIDSLVQVASQYDAIVLDQWGVLHNGTAPYAHAVEVLRQLKSASIPLAILSNSGKRAAPNVLRIEHMGFDRALFDVVMTSGEALWQDIERGMISPRKYFAIERGKGDAAAWAEGLDIEITSVLDAEALLLMGLPDSANIQDWMSLLDQALKKDLVMFCSNPDMASPREHGSVASPGALAREYEQRGGSVTYYGKPHRPVFERVSDILRSQNLLMVGDSLQHDIRGAQNAGWDSLLVQGGLYASAFRDHDPQQALGLLLSKTDVNAPTYMIEELQ